MDFNNFQEMCKELVKEHYGEMVSLKDIYVVWYCKTLQNAKALLSTTISDGRYYEVTYNGDKGEIYFDAYEKIENKCVKL